jgi:hypothetical protein
MTIVTVYKQVQQMVMEMKTGFANAMEELSKIQYGDQTLQQQLVDSKKHCSEEIVAMKQVVEELRVRCSTFYFFNDNLE